jgi:hypothetical protein
MDIVPGLLEQGVKVVDIPPGYTHHIENVGDTEMVVLFWANELFDQDAPDTCRRGSLDPLCTVDGERHVALDGSQPTELGGIEDLVGEEQIVPEAGRSHALDLAHGRAREVAMAGVREVPGERRRLERFHVRTETVARQCRTDGGDVVFERRPLDDEAGCGAGHARTVVAVSRRPW